MKTRSHCSQNKSNETRRKGVFLRKLSQSLISKGVGVEVKEDVVLFTKGKITIKRKFKGGRLA